MAYCAALVCLWSKGRSVTIVKFSVWTERLSWYARKCGLRMTEITGNFDGLQHGNKKTNLWNFNCRGKFPRLCHRNQCLSVMDTFSFWTRKLGWCTYHDHCKMSYVGAFAVVHVNNNTSSGVLYTYHGLSYGCIIWNLFQYSTTQHENGCNTCLSVALVVSL